MKKNYKALLTIYGLDKMTAREIGEIKSWLIKVNLELGHDEYSSVTKFKLMK